MISNGTPYFLDKDTSYVIGSKCVEYNHGNVDNCVRKERSSKCLGMEGRTPLKMQSSSGQVIPPTNSKLAHHPETAWPIHFLSKVSWLSKNKTNGRYIPFYFVSGPIFAVNLFATFSLSEEHPPPCLFSNIELCIIKHRGMFFLPNLYFKRDKIIKGPKFTKRTAEKRNGLTGSITILYKLS